jgi:hypothetical protein
MGRISRKLKKKLEQIKTSRSKRDADLRRLFQQVKNPPADVQTRDRLRGHHPFQAAYVAAQNMASFLAEALSVLPELKEYYDLMVQIQDEYMPDGPPFSPLTRSYFSNWAFFDACFGPDRETMGTCLLDIGPDLGILADDLVMLRLLQQSRMGIYEHQGIEGEHVQLQELVSGRTCACRILAGYLGQPGELWYAREISPPPEFAGMSLIVTTPYILISPGKQAWLDFLTRTMPKTGLPLNQPALTKNGLANDYPALESLLKYGLSPNYWHEFIFLAYVNSQNDAIFLTGLPDVPESLPHADRGE